MKLEYCNIYSANFTWFCNLITKTYSLLKQKTFQSKDHGDHGDGAQLK